MANSWDWITPRLDGAPWFEKSPLLYWMTAVGHLLHLSDEWAARLPVALASLFFLIFFFETLEREFNERVALIATGILATSAGWVAYSFVSVTDLPMSAALGTATLIALFDTRPGRGWAAGAFLGLAILAKGLVPLVLFAPVLLIARGKRVHSVIAAMAIAVPWYALCYWRNGDVFWDEFFWKHHVERFLHPTLEHVQPFWYYLPVLLAGLFPWTPLAGLLFRPKVYEDVRIRFLALYLAFGLLFFSAAQNKLPGYILPLMPHVSVMLAVALDGVGRTVSDEEVFGRMQAWWLGACALLLVAIPTVGRVLPPALLSGLSRVDLSYALALPFLLAAGLVFFLAWTGRAPLAMLTAALAVTVGAGYLKMSTFPVLDGQVSARGFWRGHQPDVARACLGDTRRQWAYGLNYYAGRPLPECVEGHTPAIVGQARLELQSER